MAFRRDRYSRTRNREANNRLANEWRICDKHGGYSPNVQGRYGWVWRECPGCSRDRYEASLKTDRQHPSASEG